MKIKDLIQRDYDLDFVVDTQPNGNLLFLDTMIQVGNTFIASIYIYRYPTQPDGLWQSILHGIGNSFVVKDVASQEAGEVLKKLKRAIREQYSRWSNEKEPYDKDIALEEFHELNSLAKDLRQSATVMKYICTRVVVYSDSRYELEKRISEIKKKLEKNEYSATVLAMEQEYEYKSLFLDHSSQKEFPNHRVGLDVPTDFAALTFSANHVFLHDKRGVDVGTSLTDGKIILDLFELDGLYRNSYNFLMVGKSGSGKSTLMKKLIYNQVAKGYMIRGFDKSGEYRSLVNYLGGKTIALDGTMGKINIFQVFPTIIDTDTNQVNEEASFNQHQGKLSTWYKTLKPNATQEEIDTFQELLVDLYSSFGFYGTDLIGNYTTQQPEEYPILEDVVDLARDRYINKVGTDLQNEAYEKIYISLNNILKSYAKLFNGHTSIEGLINEQLLFFDIDGLMTLDNEQIQTAQLFNALTLFWASLLNNGKEQIRMMKKGEVEFDFVRRGLLIIDECHNLVNQWNPSIVKYVTTMQKEGRKRFVGVGLATPEIKSLAPKTTTDANALLEEIYSLTQYKFFFNVGSENIPHLQRLTEHDITEGQIEQIPRYPQGRCLFSISGGDTIEFKVEASERELALFDGGGYSYSMESEGL